MILLTTTVVSPYLYRNYEIFSVITVTKSGGYNLLKGNHPRTKVEGTGMFGRVEFVIPEVKLKLQELNAKGPIQKHDLIKDEILLSQAIYFIKQDPVRYMLLYIKKFTSFLFIDFNSSYNNYYSILHIVPKIILALASLIGILLSIKKKINISNFFIFFYLSNIGLFSIFFILPRYSLSLLTIQLILSFYGVKKIAERFKKRL